MDQPANKLILASGSPRRREIMAAAGLSFTICPAAIDETMDLSIDPALSVQLLAARKAAAVAKNADGIVIGADTIVVYENEILGKPRDAADAFSMLSKLSGKTHSVLTGIALIRTEDGKMRTHCEETRVTFRTLSKEEIYAYIETGEPMDKAGAYGIQGKGGALAEKVEGDMQNVIGLPIGALCHLLKEMQV